MIDDLSTGRKENLSVLDRVRFVEGTINDTDMLRSEFSEVDFVFHQAAIPSVPRSVSDPLTSNEANVNGTLSVLTAARDGEVEKVMFASSSSVYGDTPTLPKVETMPPSPLSPYAVSKLAGEHYCRVFFELYGLSTTALRYFNVYGPRQDPTSQYAAVIPKFTSALLKGESPTIYGDGEQSRDFTFVKDVVRGNILAAQSHESDGKVLNCATSQRITINDLFGKIRDMIGADVEARHVDPVSGDIKHSLSDIGQAKRLMGYEPQFNINSGLERTVDHFIKEGGYK